MKMNKQLRRGQTRGWGGDHGQVKTKTGSKDNKDRKRTIKPKTMTPLLMFVFMSNKQCLEENKYATPCRNYTLI